MYQYYPIYHEMDFTHIIDEFNRLHKESSTISLLIKNHNLSIEKVTNDLNLSYDTLYSLVKRRRDIKKVSVDTVLKLSNYFHARPETLIEMKQ